MKKLVKGIVGIVLSLTLSVSTLSVTPVFAEESNNKVYTDEAIIWETEYTGSINVDNYAEYKLVVPANMTVNFKIISADGVWGISGQIFDTSYNQVDTWGGKTGSIDSKNLEEGTYYLRIADTTGFSADNYSFACYYSIDTPAVTVSSKQSKLMKVTAPKGTGSVDGYEIRYRLSGKKWANKKVETTNSLNTQIKSLKSGKIYTVQVRAFVENSDGTFYYSKWSTSKKIKIK